MELVGNCERAGGQGGVDDVVYAFDQVKLATIREQSKETVVEGMAKLEKEDIAVDIMTSETATANAPTPNLLRGESITDNDPVDICCSSETMTDTEKEVLNRRQDTRDALNDRDSLHSSQPLANSTCRVNSATHRAARQPLGLNSWNLSHNQKLVIRDATCIVITLLLSYSLPVRAWLGQNTALIALTSMVQGLRNFKETSVGFVVDQTVWFILTLLVSQGFTFGVALILPHNPVWFLIMFFIAVFVSFSIGTSYARLKIPIAFAIALMGGSMSKIYWFFNFAGFDTYELKMKNATWQITSTLGAVIIGYAIFFFCGVLVFPYKSETKVVQNLEIAWKKKAKGLIQIADAFDAMVDFVLNEDSRRGLCPRKKDEQGVNGDSNDDDKELPFRDRWFKLSQLDATVKAKRLSSLAARSHLIPSMSETAMKFNGHGYEYIFNYRVSKLSSHIFHQLHYRLNIQAERLELLAQLEEEWNSLEQIQEHEKSGHKELKHVALLTVSLLHTLSKACDAQFSAALSRPCRDPTLTSPTLTLNACNEQTVALQGALSKWLAADGMSSLQATGSPDSFGAFVISFGRLVVRLACEYQAIIQTKHFAVTSERWRRWSHRSYDFKRVVFQLSNFVLSHYVRGPISGAGARYGLTWYQQVYHELAFTLHLEATRTGFKAALISIALLVFAFIPETQAHFQSTWMTNALASAFSVLRQMRTGLFMERMASRVGGLFVGYVLAACVLSFSYLPGNTSDVWLLQGWLSFLLGLPLIWFWFAAKVKRPALFYITYSVCKEFSVTSLIVITTYTQPSLSPGISAPWTLGGNIVLNTLLGSSFAVIVGSMLFPITGLRSLRNLLAITFHNFVFLVEGAHYLTSAKQPMDIMCVKAFTSRENIMENDNEASQTHKHTISNGHLRKKVTIPIMIGAKEAPTDLDFVEELKLRLHDIENSVDTIINLQAPMLIPAMDMDSLFMGKKVSTKLMKKALEATKNLWIALWSLHHLVQDPVRDHGLNTSELFVIRYRYLRLTYTKMLSFSLQGMSMLLERNLVLQAPPPLLRPIISSSPQASQHLHYIAENMHDEIAHLGELKGPEVLADLLLFEGFVLEISKNLEIVYDFLDATMVTLPFAKEFKQQVHNIQAQYLDMRSEENKQRLNKKKKDE